MLTSESGCFVSKITEQDQEHQLQIFTSVVKFSKGTGTENIMHSVNQFISSHKEKIVLAYVVSELEKAAMFIMSNENEKYAVLSGINLVNCYSNFAKKA